MGKLIELIFGLFGKYLAYSVAVLGKKYALAATIVAVWISFVVVFASAISALIAAVNVTYTFNTYILFGFSLLPGNSQEVVTAIMAAYAASWSYIFYMRILNQKKSVFRSM